MPGKRRPARGRAWEAFTQRKCNTRSNQDQAPEIVEADRLDRREAREEARRRRDEERAWLAVRPCFRWLIRQGQRGRQCMKK